MLTLLHAKNKCADQPVHPRSLIFVFVIRHRDSILVMPAPCKVSIFQLGFIAEQANLGHAWSKCLKTFFSRRYPNEIQNYLAFWLL